MNEVLNRIIYKTVKKDIYEYQVEQIKAGLVTLISLILTAIISIQESLGVGIMLGFLPMTLLYAFKPMVTIIKGGSSTGTQAGLFSLLFGNGFIGACIGVVIFCIGLVIALFIGIPISIFVIYKRIKISKMKMV